MSDDERRRLQELEAEMMQERRLVGLARQLESATTYTGFRRVATLWTAGGGVGLGEGEGEGAGDDDAFAAGARGAGATSSSSRDSSKATSAISTPAVST